MKLKDITHFQFNYCLPASSIALGSLTLLLRTLAIADIASPVAAAPPVPTSLDSYMPRYAHIFVIVEENHAYDQVIGNPKAPNINRLAQTYGLATKYYGVVHPSQGNYIALLGGSTFGIHDDDAYYCKPGSTDPSGHGYCSSAAKSDYVSHTIHSPSLLDQLTSKGLTWKGYFEDIPAPGSKAVYYPEQSTATQPAQLYASKHNGFISFANVQSAPNLSQKLVGFEQLTADLKSGNVPNYSHIVPNQCNEMHGLRGANVPDQCKFYNDQGRIARGDAEIGIIVASIQNSSLWKSSDNNAIIITWDEDNNPLVKIGTQGCCGYDPKSHANFGGGHIPTIVITNHGPNGVKDNTPYNHYSLLRTTEDAFGINEYLNYSGKPDVKPMTPLFVKAASRSSPQPYKDVA